MWSHRRLCFFYFSFGYPGNGCFVDDETHETVGIRSGVGSCVSVSNSTGAECIDIEQL